MSSSFRHALLRPRRLAVATALTLGALAPVVLHAQGYNRATVDMVNVDPSTFAASSNSCGTGTPASGRVTESLNVSCSVGGFSGSAKSNVTNGVFKVATSINAVNTMGQGFAEAASEWYDKLTFSGNTAPATVTFRYAFNGRSGVSTPNGRGLCTLNRMQVNVPGATGYLFALDQAASNWAGAHCDSERGWELSGSTTVNVAPGTSEFFFSVFVASQSTISQRDFNSNTTGAFSASAWGDFGSTGGITGIEFRNTNGDILSDVDYSFSEGMKFYDPNATSVPEPQSWMLTLVGIAGLAAVMRARRQAA